MSIVYLGRKDSLHVLHDEDRRTKLRDDMKVFTVKEMPLVVLGDIALFAFVAGAADDRIGLAGRSADQNGIVWQLPVFQVGFESLANLIRNFGAIVGTEFKLKGLLVCM